MNFKISQEAANDLEKIWLYTFEHWSIEQADRYLNLIFNEVEYLCTNPGSGIDYGNFRKGYRRSKVKSHLIFYKINELKNELIVIRVLHELMDFATHM